MTWQSALGQIATAAALLTVGGRVEWQSAQDQHATAFLVCALFTVRVRRAGRRAGRWLHALSGDMHGRDGGLWSGERALFLTPLLKMVVNLLTCQSVSAVMQTEVTAFLHSLEGVHQP